MPNLDGTRAKLEEIFISGWAERTPIKYDNVPFDDKLHDYFVEIRMINNVTYNAIVGNGRKRHEGVFSIVIYAKQNTGSGAAYSYADAIGQIMDNLSDVNLFTYASEARRAGKEEGGRYVLIVDVPYLSDEV